jgi:hypothetical protein
MTSRWSATVLVFCAGLLTTGAAADGNDPLRLSVSPAFSFAPSTVRVHVRIAPDPANRSLAIVTDGDDYYRSSTIPLEGDRTPVTLGVSYPNLPGGTYEVVSVLQDSSGRQRATARARITVQPPV